MAAFRSFEYGRDISLLKSALRFAERVLQQEDASQSLFSSDHRHSRTAAVTVSNRIQNAGSAGIESAVMNSRLHTAIFVNVLLSNDIIGEAELEYFESVIDDFPRIGWHFFLELVSACGWREYFIQNLKTLSPRIRHRVLEAVHDISKTLPYIWSCTVFALTWSLCISPIKGISTSQDEVLSALSNLQALPSSNEASPTEECLLEDSVQFLVQLSENCSSSDMQMMDWALSLVNVILDFLQSVFESTEFSLLNPNLWLTNFGNTEEKAEQDFYSTSLCCFRVLNDLAWPDVCQLLSDADCLLFNEVKKALVVFGEMLAQEQSMRHSLCLTHDFCASSLIDGNERKSASFKFGAHEDLWHLIRKMQCFLKSLETVEKHCGAQSPLLAGLEDFVKKWDHEGVDLTVYDKETQISAIEIILKQGTIPPTPAFIIWIVSHESLLTRQWICDILNDHLNLLSHPELFHRLCQAALCSDANTCIKKLVLKMCSASPPKLQEAMLFYAFSSKSFSDDSLPLKLTDFESLLTEKLNLISDADLRMDSEDRAQVFSEFASLCMQSPTEVIEAVVDMAVTDGCTTAVAQLLMHLRVVCHCKKQWYDGRDLLGSIVLDTFQRLRSETSKHQENFTCLIKELVGHSDVLNCDWFLAQIVYCVDSAGAGGQYLDSFFPLQVTMAIAPNISTHHVVPVARILLQMLDEACIELNGARKQKVLHFLRAYLSLDKCTSQADALCNSNLSHAAIKCLLKKKCIVHEAFGVPIQQKELVLFDAKEWRNECQKVASQFPECSLTELLMPHFCLWLAGATSEEWEILSAQLRRALDIDAGHSVSAAIFIQELVMCLIGCKNYVAVGNWSYLFTCFANTVMECLKRTKELSEEDLREILLALVFALSSLPSRCLRQELLLLVDVTQWMKTSVLGGELAKLFGAALATQCYHSDFVSGLVKTSVHKLLAHKANQS